MQRTTKEIERHIQRERQDLRANLGELEDRVKAMLDWRRHAREKPAAMLGAAFVGGLLVSGMVGHRRRNRKTAELRRTAADVPSSRSGRAWESIQGVLVAVAARRFQDALTEMVSGVRQDWTRGGRTRVNQTKRTGATREEAVQGEGDYESARHYRRGVENFLRHSDPDQAARSAAPRDDRQAADMEAAERAGRDRGRH
ncbi:MAG TPA: hypothetical protein VEJ86_12275 [Candidatus Binataceae bacterium]|nr:hypothetical protein [Candidatus Binataceae bacterium]